MAETNDQLKTSKNDQGEESSGKNAATTCTSASKPRHDWYQTGSDVYINIMIKKLAKEDVHVQFAPSLVSADIELADGVKHHMEWSLSHTIVPSKSSYKVLSTKVEMKMRKEEGIQWSSLEPSTTSSQPAPASKTVVSSDDPVHKYPSSSHYTRNWDSLVTEIKKEEEEEKPEGDAAVNKLFQQIYSGGNDEVRRAMNKSFVESKGTVLSTNWSEVGNKDVEMKAPDGMEWKKYDD